jgi:hypothetical protein
VFASERSGRWRGDLAAARSAGFFGSTRETLSAHRLQGDGDMSGCYDYNDYCGYEQSWNYNEYDCKPRHRRHHRRHDCWDYAPVA